MRHRPLVHRTPRTGPRADGWWRGAVLYQIYPRSFADSNGDGIGDLPGILARIDYLVSLGIDAIWISPFFRSPMKDFGYDVADYRDVDPIFGTLDDFDRLLAAAHDRGLKVLIDFVPAHTSDQHPWFQESRQDRHNPKADWYVWADPKRDGSPPTNWMAVFGGPTWTWEPRRQQYYMHNFLKEQPQLNHHSLAMRDALLAEAAFWLERGVDGFRVDAIDFAVHDPELKNNPPRPVPRVTGGAPGSPYARQYQLYNKNSPELAELFLKPFHALTERYGGRVLLGEISGDFALLRAAEYTEGGGLDIVYTFDLLRCEPTARAVRGVVERLERQIGSGWTCWSLSNHDVERSATRFGGARPPRALCALLPVMLCALRGTICLYQGEELGLTEVELELDDLQDPFGVAFWPTFKGRDGCRTPLPWQGDAPQAGFTTGRPWLRVADEHRQLAVDRQEADPTSTLVVLRAFLAWRRTQPALRWGTIRFTGAGRDLLAFEREHAGERLWCCFNLAATPHRLRGPGRLRPAGFASEGVEIRERGIALPPWGFAFARLDREDG